MLGLILEILLGVLALHIVVTVTMVLLAKIEKEPDGTPILDTSSWHFKLAYPVASHDPAFIERFPEKEISICAYFAKLSTTLYIGWPIILFLSAIGIIVFSVFSLQFGLLAIADWGIRHDARESYGDFRGEKIWLPKVRGHRVWPICFTAPAVYVWLLWLYPQKVLHYTAVIAEIILALICFFAICALFSWFSKTDEKEVSLAREWLVAKKQRFCPLMKIKTPQAADSRHLDY